MSGFGAATAVNLRAGLHVVAMDVAPAASWCAPDDAKGTYALLDMR